MTDEGSRPRGGQGSVDPHGDVLGALHDVSNALTVLLGWVSEARAPGATAEAVQRALFVIESRARVARDLARRAIGAEASEIESGASLDVALLEVMDSLEVEAQRHEVRLVQEGRAQGTVLMAGDISQIVMNVLLNALAFAPKGSTVTLGVRESRSSIQIDVVDEGPGVPAARRETIFEGDSTREGGSGIGLRHARALARAAGGELELVASEGGAHFRITWPRGDPLARSTSQGQAAQSLRGSRVLIVEDDEHVTLLLETALSARGAVVTIARSAAELAVAIEASEHDAALIDLSPIAADVEGAVAALGRRSPKASLVFISGSAIALPAVLQASAARWVRKPFEVHEVVAALLAAKEPGAERSKA